MKYIGTLLATLILLTGCATVQQQIGKVALKLMTKKEADLSNMAAIGKYQRNIYAPDVGITTLGTEDWQEGQNLVGVMLVKPAGSVGVISLDGTVTVDGVQATNYGGGAYFAAFPEDDDTPKEVVLTSTNGSTTSFVVASVPALSIKSVNGQTDDITVDVTKDLVLELDYDREAEGKRVIVALITKAAGAKGFANFQSTLINGKITVPASAFRHKHITGGGPTGKDVSNWVSGENTLLVSLVETDRDQAEQPFDYFKSESSSFAHVPVTVAGESEGRSYVRVTGESEEATGTFKYLTSVGNAWYARPIDSGIGRIGISSLSVNATLYKQKKETNTSTTTSIMMNTKTTTTTTITTTWEFPQLDDVYWDQFLDNMYTDLTSTLRDEYNAGVVNVDEITAHPLYDELYTPEDTNTKEYIAKYYRDTKRVLPTAFEAISDRTTSLIADNNTDAKLLRELEMDAFMDVVINYMVAANEDEKIVLLPNVSFRVMGQNQGFDGQASVWLEGNIQGPGVPFNRSEFSDLNALNRIGQKDVILKLIKQAVRDITEKQKQFGYHEVWDLAVK